MCLLLHHHLDIIILKVQSAPLACAASNEIGFSSPSWNENVFVQSIVNHSATLRNVTTEAHWLVFASRGWLNELETSWVIFVEVLLQLVEHLSPGPHELLVNHPLRDFPPDRCIVYRGLAATLRRKRRRRDKASERGGQLYSLLWSDPSEQINSGARQA